MVKENQIFIEKREKRLEKLSYEKIHKVLKWACEGVSGVSVSEIELKSQLHFFNGIKSSEIQETLIKTSADLISEKTPNYQIVASKLVNMDLRKTVFGNFSIPSLYDVVVKNVERNAYTSDLLKWYSKEEFEELDEYIDHSRDYDICYAGMGQWLNKYLAQNRVTKEYYETPQIAYMLIAATLFHSYDKKIRMDYVKTYYDMLSTFRISIPSPVLAGVRTPTRQFSSCVLIDVDDSLNSINASASTIVNYVSKKAGIGINAGRIRALGTEIKNGEIKHTGLIPFLKYFYSALSSCSQGGIRNGAATVHFPFWHLEIENLIVLKNNKGVEENRIRHMDYSVQFNELFFKRLVSKGEITLFSPHEVPELIKAFYEGNNDEFNKWYEHYEKSEDIKHKETIKAFDLAELFLDERVNTGRIYAQFIDHTNTHSSFDEIKHPISMSNLCQEVTLPTKPFSDLHDESGRVALCVLSAINWGHIEKPEDFKGPCEMAVRALDALIDYQEYMGIQAELATKEFRPLGIGVINFAYFLAKNGLKYNEESLPVIDEYMEAMTYYLIKASNDLAKEKGACILNHETKYGKGIVPYMTRKEYIDELVKFEKRMDWDSLVEDLKKHGIRNATLTALMPSESSSQLAGATNGIDPPPSFVTEKSSRAGVLKIVVPEYDKLKDKYSLRWDATEPGEYLKVMGVLQKWCDQSISTSPSYNPEKYKNKKVPLTELLTHFILSYKLGLKTLYYHNTYDGASDNTDFSDECSSCKL